MSQKSSKKSAKSLSSPSKSRTTSDKSISKDKYEDRLDNVEPLEPKKKRYSTDVLFLLLLVVSYFTLNLIGLCATGKIDSEVIGKGNPQLLFHGVDYQGNICGVDPEVESLPKKWFPNPTGTNPDSDGTYVPIGLGICVRRCPDEGDDETDIYGEYGTWVAQENTADIINTCLPLNSQRLEHFAEYAFGDFLRAGDVIAIAGFGLAALASVLFLMVIRIPLVLRFIVWTSIWFVFLIQAAGGYTFIQRAKQESEGDTVWSQSSTEVQFLKALGVLLAIGAVIWLSLICYMRERIALAIGIVRESAKALTAMPLLCMFPVLYWLIFAAFTALWMYYSVYLVSSGEVHTHVDDTTGLSYQTFSYDDNARKGIAFMIFVWVWSVGFLEAIGQLTSSHSVLEWYFAYDKRDIRGSCQVLTSFCKMSRYHLGTAAFGSFLLTLFTIARGILEYIKYKLGSRKNCLVRLLLCMVSCCLSCFECCLKHLTKHAYIQTAMFGKSFCPSARRAFVLILSNLGRVTAVAIVGDFVILIGKLSIALTCAGGAYYYMSTNMADKLQGFTMPTILVGFIAFRTASLFLGVASTTANTLLQAFLIEEEYIASGKATLEEILAREDRLAAAEEENPLMDAELKHIVMEMRETTEQEDDDEMEMLKYSEYQADMAATQMHNDLRHGNREKSRSSDNLIGNGGRGRRWSMGLEQQHRQLATESPGGSPSRSRDAQAREHPFRPKREFGGNWLETQL